MNRAVRSTVFAVIAAGALMPAGGARADFEQDRQLYMLNRLDLENAQAMLSFYEGKFAATTKAAVTLRTHKNARWGAAGCDKPKPGSIGICQRIEADYQTGIRSVASLREEVRSALLTQRALVEQLSQKFNDAIAKYVAAVTLQAATVAAEHDGIVKEPTPGLPPTVRRQSPTPQDPQNDLQPNAASQSQEPPPLAPGQR